MPGEILTLPERRTFVLGEIDEITVNRLIDFITRINDYDDLQEQKTKDYERKPIRLIVNSPGGMNYDSMAAIGAIEMSETEVHAIGLGSVMSSALDVFVSCHYRSCHKLTTFMYHEVRSSTEGKAQEQAVDLEESLRLQELGDKLIISRTKLTKKRLDDVKKKKDDWYFTAQEALKYGVVEEVF